MKQIKTKIKLPQWEQIQLITSLNQWQTNQHHRVFNYFDAVHQSLSDTNQDQEGFTTIGINLINPSNQLPQFPLIKQLHHSGEFILKSIANHT